MKRLKTTQHLAHETPSSPAASQRGSIGRCLETFERVCGVSVQPPLSSGPPGLHPALANAGLQTLLRQRPAR